MIDDPFDCLCNSLLLIPRYVCAGHLDLDCVRRGNVYIIPFCFFRYASSGRYTTIYSWYKCNAHIYAPPYKVMDLEPLSARESSNGRPPNMLGQGRVLERESI